MKQIFPSSAKMNEKPVRGIPDAKYPWDKLELGESFPVDPKDIKIESLRPFATRMGKKLGKKFRVINHGDAFEVGRIAMTTTEAIQSSSNVVEALGKIEKQVEVVDNGIVMNPTTTPWTRDMGNKE